MSRRSDNWQATEWNLEELEENGRGQLEDSDSVKIGAARGHMYV